MSALTVSKVANGFIVEERSYGRDSGLMAHHDELHVFNSSDKMYEWMTEYFYSENKEENGKK